MHDVAYGDGDAVLARSPVVYTAAFRAGEDREVEGGELLGASTC